MSGQQTQTILEIRIRADSTAVRDVRRQVDDFAFRLGLDAEAVEHTALAVGEALANVIEHGYGGPCDKPIEITASPVTRKGRKGITVRIRDRGRRVDPDQIRGRDLEDVRPGGLGVHIIRSVMDEVRFATADDDDCGMVLTMIKMGKA